MVYKVENVQTSEVIGVYPKYDEALAAVKAHTPDGEFTPDEIHIILMSTNDMKERFEDYDKTLRFLDDRAFDAYEIAGDNMDSVDEFNYLSVMARAWNKVLGFSPKRGELRYYPIFGITGSYSLIEAMTGNIPDNQKFSSVQTRSACYSPFGPFIGFPNPDVAKQFGEEYIDHFQKFLMP